MNTDQKLVQKILILLVVSIPVILMPGCAAKKTIAESPETGITLKYKLPGDPGLYYTTRSDIKQEMNIQGQVIGANIEQVMAFELNPVAIDDGKMTFNITMDTLEMDVKSPMANFSANTANVLGKSFNMVLSDTGEELDLSEAESLEYSIAQAGNRSVALNFQTFFPDLPDQKIKIGDTWMETDTITEESDTEEVLMILTSNNRFEGMETVEGYECVKVVATLSGPRTGIQNAQGVTLKTEGEVEGTMTWYFAFKEGIYVKSVMDSSSESTITASGAQNISFPMKMDIQSVVEVAKR